VHQVRRGWDAMTFYLILALAWLSAWAALFFHKRGHLLPAAIWATSAAYIVCRLAVSHS
jgi:hypothetical protein